VILTVLLALKKPNTSEIELIDLKMDLIKQLLNSQIPKEKIRALMNFLKHYVRFSKENSIIFEKKLDQFTGKTYPMGIEQFLLQRAENQGILKGEKRGEKIGEKRGELIGELKSKVEVIRNAHMNGASIEFISKIVNLPIEKIRQILDELGLE
jgi:acetone carboxylase gamma subunit